MNKSLSRMVEEDQELSSQAKNPSEYSILKHDASEVSYLPVDSNLLFFNDPQMKLRYFKALYIDSLTGNLSKEFSYNLLTFYIYLTIYIQILVSVVVSLYSYDKMGRQIFIFHIVYLGMILVFAYLILIGIKSSKRVLLYSRFLFAFLALIFYTYLILGSSFVLPEIAEDNHSDNFIPMTAGIIGFTYFYRRVQFDSYRHVIFTLIPVLCIYIALNLSYNKIFIYSSLTEFAAICLFVIMQINETHIVENRTIQLFYRMEKEQDYTVNDDSRRSVVVEEASYNTLTDSILKKCDFIMKEVKYATSVIIFKDVKNRLKNVQNDLSFIKSKVVRLEYTEKFDLTNQDIDDQDKEFISQNYLQLNSATTKPIHDVNKNQIQIQRHLKTIQDNLMVNVLSEKLERIGKDWNFNIFYIHEKSGKSISVIAMHIFTGISLDITLKVHELVFFTYFESLEKNYKENPYHSALHGSDVFSSVYYFIQSSSISSQLSKLDIVSVMVASLGHDVGHPGFTNRYLIQTRDKLALQYNDQSVLENMHCSLIFLLMSSENCDIFSEVNEEDWSNCRRIIISMVLETDLSRHFEIFNKFRTRALTLLDLVPEKFDDKILLLSMALKCADIGHSAKNRDLHLKWTSLVTEEFFRQGDREKVLGLPISMYCERSSTDISKSQSGFLKNICLPIYEIWTSYLKSPEVDLCLNQLRENFRYWDENYKKKTYSAVQKLQEESLN